MRPLTELLGPSLDRIQAIAERDGTLSGLATGYYELDDILVGLQPTSLTIIGARPAMGKTSLALGIIANCGVTKHMEIVKFLKEEHGLGHGHANALVAWTLAGNIA
jgi:replicative DNA helicase